MSWVAEEHAMWHTFNEVPSGPMGGHCPWDACGWLADDLAMYEDDEFPNVEPEPVPAGVIADDLDDAPF